MPGAIAPCVLAPGAIAPCAPQSPRCCCACLLCARLCYACVRCERLRSACWGGVFVQGLAHVQLIVAFVNFAAVVHVASSRLFVSKPVCRSPPSSPMPALVARRSIATNRHYTSTASLRPLALPFHLHASLRRHCGALSPACTRECTRRPALRCPLHCTHMERSYFARFVFVHSVWCNKRLWGSI